jgi:hypothetical protein
LDKTQFINSAAGMPDDMPVFSDARRIREKIFQDFSFFQKWLVHIRK